MNAPALGRQPAANDLAKPAASGPAGLPVQSFVGPRGTLVNLFTAGDGAPIVALHCSGGHGQAWRSLLPWLGGDFRLHCPDLYGCGHSESWPGPRRMTLEDDADLIAALLHRFDRPVHLIGHSYGGAVALRTAIAHPGRLCSLTLYEPVVFHLLKPEFGGHAPALRQIEVLAEDMRAAYLRDDATEAARMFVDYWNGPEAFRRLSPQKQAALIVQVPRLWLDFALTLACKLPLHAFRAVAVPTLLLTGTRSPGPTRLIGERLARMLPLVRHALLPELGHMAPLSHPDAVGRVLLPFLVGCEKVQRRRACA